MPEKKIYVDTCMISRIFQEKSNRMSETELRSIESLCDDDTIILVTSNKVLEELDKDPNESERLYKKVVYKFIQKISRSSTTKTTGFTFPIQFPRTFGTTEDKRLFSLLKSVYALDDAEHMLTAIENECGYFLTSDKRTIVNRYEKNRALFVAENIDIKVIQLSELGQL